MSDNISVNDLRTLVSRMTAVDTSAPLVASSELPMSAPNAMTTQIQVKVRVNGNHAVTQQTTRVMYLSTDKFLLLPDALRTSPTAATLDDIDFQRRIWASITAIATPEGPGANSVLVSKTATSAWLGQWSDYGTVGAADAPDAGPRGISLFLEYGILDSDGNLVAVDIAESPRTAFVMLKYGEHPTQSVEVQIPLESADSHFASISAALQHPDVVAGFTSHIAARLGHNFNQVDAGFLGRPSARWTDDMCQKVQSIERFVPQLTEWTLTCIAAMNYPNVANQPILAWTRAYAVSVGLLPAEGSAHNREYVFVTGGNQNATVELLLNAHPTGDEARAYLRGCLSLVGAFGMLHLGNDHTFKANDKSLKRKAETAIKCLRTIFGDEVTDALAAEALLEVTIRTTCHPFGLSSTYGTFIAGCTHHFLAEALCIRRNACPPALQRVAIILAETERILGLPIGAHIQGIFSRAVSVCREIMSDAETAMPKYSFLHRMYGFERMTSITDEQLKLMNGILPVVAGYSNVFNLDQQNNPVGAGLSYVLANASRDMRTMVEMYTEAFGNYRDQRHDIVTLLNGLTRIQSSVAAPSVSN